ncbi:hypothetical protein [Bryobacter aggregatus]|uniref:hypothetical protein n=1 Tax=Bryobacter aggregatus TaxID=360054 RepID=UPI0004E1A0EA|nr:hypothetical protein [Bryobacter aggregatus]
MLATELRKNLFQNLDKAVKGEPLLIEYKGVTLRLEAITGGSKLAGAIQRNAIIGDPDALIHSDKNLMDALESKWLFEDKKL